MDVRKRKLQLRVDRRNSQASVRPQIIPEDGNVTNARPQKLVRILSLSVIPTYQSRICRCGATKSRSHQQWR
jgi:hypothetical protein